MSKLVNFIITGTSREIGIFWDITPHFDEQRRRIISRPRPGGTTIAEEACVAAGAAVGYAATGKRDSAILTAALAISWLPTVHAECCWNPREVLFDPRLARLECISELSALLG
jgi:hypothetical protein